MSFLKRQSLVHQIALAASFVSLVIFAGLIIFTSHFTEGYALKKTEEELTHQVASLVNMLELSHENAVARANNSLARIKGSGLSVLMAFVEGRVGAGSGGRGLARPELLSQHDADHQKQ